MKTSPTKPGKPGFVSYLMVLSTGAVLTMLMIFTYRQAMTNQATEAQIQLRTDYAEKEDAILRSIVKSTPNRAIRAMKSGSAMSYSVYSTLRWSTIFSDALTTANARTSIDSGMLSKLDTTSVRKANSGDSSISSVNPIFNQIDGVNDNYDSNYVSAGINRNLGAGFPVPLQTSNFTTMNNDIRYPIISNDKIYGSLAQSGVGLPVTDYPRFNLLKYPQINFGYAKPGDNFVAKRNWWAFTMNLANADMTNTQVAYQYDKNNVKVASGSRDYVLSIYEIPSQLAISASTFTSLGQYSTGESWQNVTISGGVFADKARVEGNTALTALSSRHGMSLSSNAVIGGQSFTSNPFTPGVREAYQVTQGEFFPVSLASESGRVAFVPINRGAEFFDRIGLAAESNTLSPTTWNNYSVGALQCAMRLDITQCVSSTDMTPTKFRFSYLKNGARVNMDIDLTSSGVAGLPSGYLFACNDNQTKDFGTAVVDVAYGASGSYGFQYGVTGSVTFNTSRFGDPAPGFTKSGYYKPSYPFEKKLLPNGQWAVAVYPQRFKSFLAALGADSTAVNNSLVVNVDYSTATGSVYLRKPNIPCTDSDYAVLLQESSDLTSFTKGFSLVTNLRTFFGDDFNIVETAPPSGYTLAAGEKYYPPSSIFVPEKRYGYDVDPFAVDFKGQVGSLVSDSTANAVRPLDSKAASGASFSASKITVNLKPITHPGALPPITMMNWLVVLEERSKEFVNY